MKLPTSFARAGTNVARAKLTRAGIVSLLACVVALALGCIVPQPETETSEASSVDSSSETGAPLCGWDADSAWYACGFEGAEPSGSVPRECGADYVVGEVCPSALLAGCCDESGALWFCQELADTSIVIASNAC